MDMIKDKNDRDLAEAEDMKKRWQKIHKGIIPERSLDPGQPR